MLDLAQALELPVLIVAGTQLGTLHHTLATVHSIRARGVDIAGVLLNGSAHGDNARQIRDRGQVSILGRVPELFPADAQSIAELVHGWKSDQWTDPCEEETPVLRKPESSLSLEERDRKVIWHPDTQHQTCPVSLEIARAHGAILTTTDDRELVDGLSSWWVSNHGHTHPRIARAIGEQARSLEQVVFAGCTHEPAVRLAEELLPSLPGKMSRLFYSDDGSTAVEVALKACLQIARARGVERPLVAALDDAYHGDTIGAMSVGARSGYSWPFDPYLFEVERLPTPAGSWDPDSPQAQAGARKALEALENWIASHSGRIACVIVEPLVQGWGGMRMYPRSYLEGLDALCREHKVPWIADEVFTGFGRTGSFFACSPRPGVPDLHPSAVCVSKGLTGGFLPLGATAFTEEIFAPFLSRDRSKAFFHGHSFTGNPLGCAAALASLELLREPSTKENWVRVEGLHRKFLSGLERRHHTRGSRVLGTIAAFELPSADEGYLAETGQKVALRCQQDGVLIRPLGDTMYVLPPWCIRDAELARVYDALDRSIGVH